MGDRSARGGAPSIWRATVRLCAAHQAPCACSGGIARPPRDRSVDDYALDAARDGARFTDLSRVVDGVGVEHRDVRVCALPDHTAIGEPEVRSRELQPKHELKCCKRMCL